MKGNTSAREMSWFACSSLNQRQALKTLDQDQQAMPACLSCVDFGKETLKHP
jgi:hypothetical protein